MNPIFSEIVLMFLLAILVVLICRRLKLPNIVGFLITGLLCGPSAFAIVSEAELVDSLSEVGVSLLLFTIGMELSTKELKRMAKPLFIGGTTQVLLTIGLVFLACFFFAGAPKAIVFGCLIALSSTAIVLTLLQQKAQGDSPQGRVCLAILIFQDLAIVPIMLLFPMLSGGLQMDMGSALLTIGKAVAVLAALAAFAVFLLPRLMMLIVRTRSRELMLMMTLGLCLTVAEITSRIGLSTSLGAFLAGLMLAESEYSLNVTENILPFKDIFTSIFFISVGMQIDMNMFISNLHWIVLMAAGIIAVKTAAVLPAVKLVGYSLHTAIIAALSLAQIGEFSFVLVTNAESLGILTEHQSQLFIAASILTMIATPILMGIAPAAADAALKLMGRSRIAEPEETGEEGEELRDHIIIIGFGIGGQTLARVAQKSGIPYVISELNPDTVARYKKDHPIRHGDAQYPLVLEHLGIKEARVLAILTSDPAGMRGIIANARAANPNIRIVVRSRFIGETEQLINYGATDVIPEEFESAIELFSRVLGYYLVPMQTILSYVNKIRGENYAFLRSSDAPLTGVEELRSHLAKMRFLSFTVEPGCLLDGRSLREGILRSRYKSTLIGYKRNGETMTSVDADTVLLPGDTAYLFSDNDVPESDIAEAFIAPEQEDAAAPAALPGEGIATDSASA